MPTRKGAFLYATFNLTALLQRASRLRRVSCSCNEAQVPRSGSLNWAIFLSFEDDVEWVFLSPRKDSDASPETVTRLLESKVATMTYIKQNSSIPVPEVHDYSCTEHNSIGIPFVLMSKGPGFPLSKFSWDDCPEGMTFTHQPTPYIGEANKEKIMRQLGGIVSQLLRLRFDKIGSLFMDKDGNYLVEECLSPALVWNSRDSFTDHELARGPFKHEHLYYESLLSAFLLHVKELPMGPHVFFAPIPELREFNAFRSYKAAVSLWNDFVAVGSKCDSSKNRLDYCIAGRFLREMIPLISQQAFLALDDLHNQFNGYPLCHPDLSPSNIFVDDNFKITCIIDWECSSTVPISTLLMTPGLRHPRNEVEMTLVHAFRAGFIRHFGVGRHIDPAFWECTRRSWLFTRLVTLDGLQEYRYFKELYTSVYKPQSMISVPKLIKRAREEQEFVDLAKVLAENDRSASEIKREEEKYFRFSPEKEVIARKLSHIAETSEEFVADKTVWLLIELGSQGNKVKVPKHDLSGVPSSDNIPVEPTWRNYVRVEELPWLRGHCIEGKVIFLAAGNITMALKAQKQQVLGDGDSWKNMHVSFRQVHVGRALLVPDDGVGIETLVVLRPYTYTERKSSASWKENRIFSVSDNGESTGHSRGLVTAVNSPSQEPQGNITDTESLEFIERASNSSRSVPIPKKLYEELRDLGIVYSGLFNTQEYIRASESSSICQFKTPDIRAIMPSHHQ